MASSPHTASRAALAMAGVLGALGAADAAHAQASPGVVDDIVVTATRRPVAISKVPASITAITQEALDSVGASTVIDGVTTAPNLHATVANDVSIRGVGSNLFTPSAGGTPVAIHVDGIYTNDRAILTRSSYDLERLEVLRGPQGTLYGRNATGGVLNLITASPEDGFSAYADAAYASGDDITLRGAINVPVTPDLAFRLAGFAEAGGGFQTNPTPDQRDGDAPDFVSGRLSVRWSPLQQLEWRASVSYAQDRSISGTAQYAYFLDNGGVARPTNLPGDDTAPFPPSDGPLAFGDNVSSDFADRNRADLNVISVRSSLRFALDENVSLTYLAGYNRLDDESNTNAIPFIFRSNAVTTQENSHELNVNYEGERWNAVAGLYHFTENSGGASLIHVWIPDGQDQPELTPAVDQISQNARSVNTTDAIFGQATVDLAEDVRLTLGARYTHDKIEAGAAVISNCPFGLASSPFQSGHDILVSGSATCASLNIPNFSQVVEVPAITAEFGRPNYLGTLEYDLTPDVLVYATVATGYRTGGVSDTSPAVVFYRPETNTNYEAGLRARLLSGALSLNLTAFRETYRDMQIQILDIPTPITLNAAEATIDGVEAEYFLAFSRADRIAGYFTWLDARFDSFPTAYSAFRNTVTDAGGNHLAQAPEWSARFSYSHIFDLGDLGQITPTLQTYWQSDSFAWYTNNIEDEVPAYFRSDVMVRYETAGARVSVDAFVNNVEDYRNANSVFPALGIGRMQWTFYSRGRLAGVRLGVHF